MDNKYIVSITGTTNVPGDVKYDCREMYPLDLEEKIPTLAPKSSVVLENFDEAHPYLQGLIRRAITSGVYRQSRSSASIKCSHVKFIIVSKTSTIHPDLMPRVSMVAEEALVTT